MRDYAIIWIMLVGTGLAAYGAWHLARRLEDRYLSAEAQRRKQERRLLTASKQLPAAQPFNFLELQQEVQSTPGLWPVVLRVGGVDHPLVAVTSERWGDGLADGRLILSADLEVGF